MNFKDPFQLSKAFIVAFLAIITLESTSFSMHCVDPRREEHVRLRKSPVRLNVTQALLMNIFVQVKNPETLKV